nr:endonuclease-reverse transcriptase HmRTE-e01 [Haemonchus contortus]
MYDVSTAAMRAPHGLTEAIDVTVGVYQGSALGLFLSLVTLDVITSGLLDVPLKTVLYCDDIARLAQSREDFQEKLQKWQEGLTDNGLRLNVKKTKLLSSKECTDQS